MEKKERQRIIASIKRRSSSRKAEREKKAGRSANGKADHSFKREIKVQKKKM